MVFMRCERERLLSILYFPGYFLEGFSIPDHTNDLSFRITGGVLGYRQWILYSNAFCSCDSPVLFQDAARAVQQPIRDRI